MIWSTEALVDLEVIYDFLAEKSPSAAQRITENLLARARQIETFPESGAIQEILRGTGKDYRYFVEGNYKIIYSYQSERQVSISKLSLTPVKTLTISSFKSAGPHTPQFQVF